MTDDYILEKTQNATKWSSITEICAKLITPVTNMILARLLTPEAFGVIATVNMVVSFADMFSDAGFQKYLIQHDFKNKDEYFKSTTVAFWTNLLISVIAWFIIFLFSDNIATLVGNPGLGKVIWIAALSLPLTSFSSIQTSHYRKTFDFKKLFYVRIISACVPLVVTVPIAFATRSYWALVIGTICSNLVNAVLLTIWSVWKPTFYYNLKMLKEMFAYSWWILLESFVVWLTSYIGTFIVGIYLTQAEVGYYKTGMSTVNQITSLITAATSAPLFSALSRLKDNDDEFKKLYFRYIRAIGILIIPLGIGIYIYRHLVTMILLGSQWKEIEDFIGLWGLMSSVSMIWGTYCDGVYNAKGKPQLSVFSQILHLIVLVPVIIIGCNIGFESLCTMRSLARLELVLVQFVIMWFAMRISPAETIKQSLPSLLCAFVMAIAGSIMLRISSNMVWQIVSVGICIVIYFVLYSLLFKEKMMEAIVTVGIKLPVRQNSKEKDDEMEILR